jgi:hypothetical protein
MWLLEAVRLKYTRTWTVYDASGNSATCNQTITIERYPCAGCGLSQPQDLKVPSDFNLPYATFSIPAFDYSDNCTAKSDILILHGHLPILMRNNR